MWSGNRQNSETYPFPYITSWDFGDWELIILIYILGHSAEGRAIRKADSFRFLKPTPKHFP